ncbi:phage GP46 family protein [Cupriavidus sp. 2TAF22]|uniref:phage GP46 family protein n=1 Tax=unclassified Cupriavidus TaxID=2640874 RepID=UPI003F8F6167
MTTTAQQALLYRAAEISLFTWRRAGADDQLDDDQRMGWWGDTFPAVAGDRIGSRLWLLRRKTVVPEVLRAAEAYAREALQWMIDDELVRTVDVQVTTPDRTRVNLVVTLSDDGGPLPPFNFDDIWQVQHGV